MTLGTGVEILWRFLRRPLRAPWGHAQIGHMYGQLRRYRKGLRQLGVVPHSSEYRNAYRAISRAARYDAERRGMDQLCRKTVLTTVLLCMVIAPLFWHSAHDFPLRGPLNLTWVGNTPQTVGETHGLLQLSSTDVNAVMNVMFNVVLYVATILAVFYVALVPTAIEKISAIPLPYQVHRVWIFVVVVAYGVVSYSGRTDDSFWVRYMVSVMFGVFVALVLTIVLWPVKSLLLAGARRAQIAAHPDAIVISCLVGMVADLSDAAAQEFWLSPRFRERMMRELDIIALSFEKSWWRPTGGGGVVVDFRERCHSIAAGVRARRLWLAVPKADTQKNFEGEIEKIALSVIVGDLDALPAQDVSAIPLTQRARRHLAAFVTALLPMVILAVFQKTELRLPEATAGWLSLAVFAWATVAILAAMDPSLGAKISTMKDVRDFFSLRRSDDAA